MVDWAKEDRKQRDKLERASPRGERADVVGTINKMRWSQGRGPRGTRASNARTGRRSGKACPRRWTVVLCFGVLKSGKPFDPAVAMPTRGI